ncbi:MAG TPA: hypothetical protein VGC54_07795 [Planctomycetota bacterium]
MKFLSLALGGVLAACLLTASVSAQQANDVDPNPPLTNLGVGTAALGDLLLGPIDVETVTGDNLCLGIEKAWGAYWVTSRGSTVTGDDPVIHKFDMAGNYIASYPQVSNSTLWRGRDMQADETANKLYVGSDNGEVSVYDYDPATKGLTHNSLFTLLTAMGTVRALCSHPNGKWYTKSFTSPLWEFDMVAGGGSATSFASATISAYGMGSEPGGSIWATSTGPSAQEMSTTGGVLAGTFGPTWGTAQGGADVYHDSRNQGSLSMVILGQGTPDSFELYDLAIPTASSSDVIISVDGPCPGPFTVTVTGCTPGGLVKFVSSTNGTGNVVVSGGPCTNVQLCLALPIAVHPSNWTANAAGVVVVGPITLGAGACGAITFQVVDVASCRASVNTHSL